LKENLNCITCYNQQIKICSKNKNAKVAKRYKNCCLPGDSPKLMPLDCHFLFVDMQEGATKNVALTYHIKENNEDAGLNCSFAMPVNIYESLQ
jgi:hypothetical protein